MPGTSFEDAMGPQDAPPPQQTPEGDQTTPVEYYGTPAEQPPPGPSPGGGHSFEEAVPSGDEALPSSQLPPRPDENPEATMGMGSPAPTPSEYAQDATIGVPAGLAASAAVVPGMAGATAGLGALVKQYGPWVAAAAVSQFAPGIPDKMRELIREGLETAFIGTRGGRGHGAPHEPPSTPSAPKYQMPPLSRQQAPPDINVLSGRHRMMPGWQKPGGEDIPISPGPSTPQARGGAAKAALHRTLSRARLG